MRMGDTVTFGGGGLDRAAHLREQVGKGPHLLADAEATGIAIWRGKPLFAGTDKTRLVRLPVGHDILATPTESPVFLGLAEHRALFAFDVSEWSPDHLPGTGDAILDSDEIRAPDLPPDHRFADLRAHMAALSPLDAELAATAKSILVWHLNHGFCAKCGARSRITMAGWQRDCPECGTHHFPRVDPVVIMLITHGNNVLLGRSPGWPERVFSLLAGYVEPGETVEAAVRREVLEEAGIRVRQVAYLASQPWPYTSSLMIGCKGAAQNAEICIDSSEIDAALWISREDLIEVFAGRNDTIMPPRRGSIAYFLLQNWLADRLD